MMDILRDGILIKNITVFFLFFILLKSRPMGLKK